MTKRIVVMNPRITCGVCDPKMDGDTMESYQFKALPFGTLALRTTSGKDTAILEAWTFSCASWLYKSGFLSRS